ncbi:hypothetical protein [Peribacillus frigoritolerans]
MDDIVEEQVSSFFVSRLEEMVVSITKKELSMITYLGPCLVESSVYFKVS